MYSMRANLSANRSAISPVRLARLCRRRVTVVAWDGTTLAADKRGTNYGFHYTVSKLSRVDDCLVGVFGSFARAGNYLSWLKAGRDPATYPAQVTDSECYLLVVHRSGLIERFENSGYPVAIEERSHACGSGRDFAIAAMHCGKTAREAVELTCRLTIDCGNGIDTLTFENEAR